MKRVNLGQVIVSSYKRFHVLLFFSQKELWNAALDPHVVKCKCHLCLLEAEECKIKSFAAFRELDSSLLLDTSREALDLYLGVHI